MKRYSWSRQKRESGLAGTCQRSPMDWHLSYGKGNVVARVSYYRERDRWYFYGDGFNSLGSGGVYVTDNEAKDACLRHVKAQAAEA